MTTPTAPGTLSSTAVDNDGAIAARYTCDGEDVSPELSWTPMDRPAAGIYVVVTDPDAGGFVHWVAGPLPTSTTSLPEGASGEGDLEQGTNGFGDVGWGGPCPPSGTTHHYRFLVVSLAADLQGPLTAASVLEARQVQGAALTATYTRP
ncbi:YbhB/YbcL family Raf kinase inhibitor-like protein [Isoptericola sp. b441]|uniref:YbhB/YbcL family Raf kinase inhibitor-like protein n=1 Tax=Actinotalea lenta TaxID=3064654 RepID=A0ABT9D5F1_9CELL|nr:MULTISPECIES: YbhB/YbcL family Raf kinase inhibitor-like protein [unclassified Isoptericola]MDO8106010.1 YbhB/YbcL family Raf kinase inhibitor-like protein [Isoptericola sp. b441]MDO8122271.1 YbhB/YbcL family Raf kinase inhibitor-like protein [Isoptericola sp. b490]